MEEKTRCELENGQKERNEAVRGLMEQRAGLLEKLDDLIGRHSAWEPRAKLMLGEIERIDTLLRQFCGTPNELPENMKTLNKISGKDRTQWIAGIVKELEKYILPEGNEVSIDFKRPVVIDEERTEQDSMGGLFHKPGPDIFLNIHIVEGGCREEEA